MTSSSSLRLLLALDALDCERFVAVDNDKPSGFSPSRVTTQLIISKLSKTVPVGSESAANAVEVVAAVIAGTDIWTLLLEALVCFCKFPNSG
jgi:hypothetical protein